MISSLGLQKEPNAISASSFTLLLRHFWNV